MNLSEDSLLAKIGAAIFMAVIGGGLTTIVDNKITNIRQEEKIIQIAELKQRVDLLNQGLSEANTNLALFNLQYRQIRDDIEAIAQSKQSQEEKSRE